MALKPGAVLGRLGLLQVPERGIDDRRAVAIVMPARAVEFAVAHK